MIELELTFLAKSLPENLKECDSKKIIDLYVENGTDHADLRIRKNGKKHEMTRKTPVDNADVSKQTETTITLKDVEFESLSVVKSRKIEKTRYLYKHGSLTAEFDVFEGSLNGLVMVDFEFDSESEKDKFLMPDFCLANITQESFVAGGLLAGKSYADIEEDLARFDYKKLSVPVE